MLSTRTIKRDFRALGRLVRESETQVTFPSLLPVTESDTGRNRWPQSINTCLCVWCHHYSFGFFDNGMAFMASGWLVSDGIHISQRRQKVFAHKLTGFFDRSLSYT